MALDSAMNRWVEDVPEHCEDADFLSQLDVTTMLFLSALGVGGFKEAQGILASICFPLVSILRNATPHP